MKGELDCSGNRLGIAGADEGGERDGFPRHEGNPFAGEAVGRVGRIPIETVKMQQCGRVGVLDAQSETIFAADDVHVERANGQVRVESVGISVGAQRSFLGRSAGELKSGREPAGGRNETNDVTGKAKNREVRRSFRRKANSIAGGGAHSIVAGLKPFEAGEGEPSVGLLQRGGMIFAPLENL